MAARILGGFDMRSTAELALVISLLLTVGLVTSASSQATGTPYFHSPYPAFEEHELGATLSFPKGGTGFEGFYGFGHRRVDFGIRGGAWVPDLDAADTELIAGAHVRGRLVQYGPDFPLDASVAVGVGTTRGFDNLYIPAGLTVGRRLNVEASRVSFVPYVQPTLILTTGENQDTDLLVVLGLGLNASISRRLDLRLSVGVGDLEGVALSAVWVK